MKTCLVQGLALLLMVGALYGQGSQSTSQPAGGQHSHDQMQMPSTQGQTTDQNAPPAQNQQIPGMQMLDKPVPQQPEQQQTPPSQQMPGMQMPQNPEAEQPAPKANARHANAARARTTETTADARRPATDAGNADAAKP